MKVIKVIELKNMPFDRWTENGYAHATGNYCIFDNGNREIEYTDSDFEYSENCMFEYEKKEN